jgi:phosphoribosyl-AMP cyclohydrolase
MSLLDGLKYNADGLIPAIVQDHENGQVLMMAWMNRESLQKTIETGLCNYWSRSRQSYWLKGETSGHVQHVKRISVDCDLDTLLIQVDQVGAACHENYRSCFFRDLADEELRVNAEKLTK